jgi:hypothetical protein
MRADFKSARSTVVFALDARMIEFAGTRDRANCRTDLTQRQSHLRGNLMANPEHLASSHHGDFWSQVPVVLFTLVAVVAIVVVNTRTHAVPAPVPAEPVIEIHPAPVNCADCGEVIAVRAAAAEEVGAPGQVDSGVVLDVRMTDGSVRTVKQFSRGFDVGDRVQVNGNALVAGG